MKALLMSPKSTASGAKSPHCKVCGDESSGFHYGVDSCEGCKGFFRRCITQGMTHKCANDEKCDITPFTRNSCQYCRLKKCFQVGMSREASRLGRRPKRLKDVSGEGRRGQTTNLPIAPYPTPQELQKLNSDELQKILQNLKPEDMQAWMTKAQQSFREHAKTSQNSSSSATVAAASSPSPTISIASSTTPQLVTSDSSTTTQLLNAKNVYVGNSSIKPGNAISSTSALTSTVAIITPASVSIAGTSASPQQQGGFTGNGNISNIGGSGSGGASMDSNMLLGSAPPSPFNDLNLGLAELSPLDPNMAAIALGHNLGGGSGKNTPAGGGKFMGMGINGNNSAYSPGSATDMPSPLAFPGSVDHVDLAVSPSNFMSFNPSGNGSLGDPTSPGSFNIGSVQSGPDTGAMDSVLSPIDSKANLNLNMNSFAGSSGVSSPAMNLLSPGHIKQEIDLDTGHQPFFIDPRINCLADTDKVLAEVKELPTEKRRLLIDQVTDAIVEAHMTTTLNTQDNIREANERITREQSMMVMQASEMAKKAMDPNIMWQHFFNALVPEITKLVKFSKKLPGFTDIPMDDQFRLIKQGIFEVMMVRITLLIDIVNNTMIDPCLKMKTKRSMIREMPPLGPFLDEFFEIARLINPLNLTDGEIGLFGAILMICPDRRGLETTAEIHTVQQLYLQALYLLMRLNHKDVDGTFCALIATIPAIRQVNDNHFRFLNEIKMQSGTQFKFPDLHNEIFGSID